MNYDYPDWAWEEIRRMLRKALPANTRLARAPLREDVRGVDADHVVMAGRVQVAIRCRFDRPITAPQIDVTYRTTEIPMIAARTYAPLDLFLWFRGRFAEVGRLVDVYRMDAQITPPLAQRQAIPNGDGTAFIPVTIAELHEARALLRHGDRDNWITEYPGGLHRLEQILGQEAA